MSTESESPPAPAETVAPGTAVKAAWRKFKRGELIPYKVMAILLVVAAGIGVVWYMQTQQRVSASKMWLDLEAAATPQDLEKVVSDYPNTVPAQLAEFHLARIKLGPEGIDQLVTGEDAQRKRGLAGVESAKEVFNRLAPELKDSPVLQAECYLGLAKAELALVGISKDGRLDTFQDRAVAAAEWLEKLATVADGTPWGDDAKKLAADLRVPNSPLFQDMRRVQTILYNMTQFPMRPGSGPFGPGGNPFGPGGGFPGGFPMGGVPGLPGGGMPQLPPNHPPF